MNPDVVTGGWHFADVWEAVADALPTASALVQGDRRISWSQFDRRADGVAVALIEAGLTHQDKVAQYLLNGPEYIEAVFATFKAGLVPVNTNYRYTGEELVYLWDNADVAAVVLHSRFLPTVSEIRHRLPGIKAWICVDDGTGACPSWAIPFEVAARRPTSRVDPPWRRTGNDLVLLYTGGTTGMPKGVMWRHDDLFSILNAKSSGVRYPLDEGVRSIAALLSGPGPVALPACPLMHASGLFSAANALASGGSVVCLERRAFDAVELLDTVHRERVEQVTIVGDVFAKPIVAALHAEPDRWDLSSLQVVVSSGAIWSEPTKQDLCRFAPRAVMVDAWSSSEAIGLAQSVSRATRGTRTATFTAGEDVRLLDDQGHEIKLSPGATGRVALKGRVPVGYYKDSERSSTTFVQLRDGRYSVPGDYATVEADGSLRLLGRGAMCINTGGEKVFPEEVEEVLKSHPAVFDAAVLGVPHETFGETVVAIVQLGDPGTTDEDIDEELLITLVRERLAGYKAPRWIRFADSVNRGPNGKIDYRGLRQRITADV